MRSGYSIRMEFCRLPLAMINAANAATDMEAGA